MESNIKNFILILTAIVVILLLNNPVTRYAKSAQSSQIQAPPLTIVTSTTQSTHHPETTISHDPYLKVDTNVVASEHANSICAIGQGKIIKDKIYSKIYEKVIPVMVYFPSCDNKDLENRLAYPSLYLLHGLGSDASQWVGLGLVKEMDVSIAAGVSPFIVIMPQIPEIATWPSDNNAVLFTEELIPYIDKRYPTLTDRENRAIGGLSRGAAWALRIGLTHSDSFGKIGLHSLSLDDQETNHWAGILNKMETPEIPQLFIDSGKSDAELGSAQLFDDLLTSLHVPHESTIFDGGHNEVYWSEHLPIYLEWYAHDW